MHGIASTNNVTPSQRGITIIGHPQSICRKAKAPVRVTQCTERGHNSLVSLPALSRAYLLRPYAVRKLNTSIHQVNLVSEQEGVFTERHIIAARASPWRMTIDASSFSTIAPLGQSIPRGKNCNPYL